MQEPKKLSVINIVLIFLVLLSICFTIHLSRRVTETINLLGMDTGSNDSVGVNSLMDKDISDNLTISAEGTVDWSALTNYPVNCQSGEVVQIIDDTLSCISILTSITDLPQASPSEGDIGHISSAAQIYDWVIGRGYISNDSNVLKGDLNDEGVLGFDWNDDEISNKLTIDNTGSVDWTALGSYPSGCDEGQAIRTVGDTLVCVDIGVGSSLWTEGGSITYLTSIVDNLAIGGTDATAPFYFDIGLSALRLPNLLVDGAAVFNDEGVDEDFRIEGDTEDHLFVVDAGSDEVRLGDWDSNYTTFAKDGGMTLVGTARVRIDSWVGANSFKAPGLKPASFVESGLTGVWQFGDEIEANQERISGTFKIPTEMDRTVVPIFTVGWSTTTIYTDDAVDNETAEWQLEYLWIGANEDTTAAAQETLTRTTTLTIATPSEGLVFSQFSGIDLPEATDQAMFFRITRLSAGNDTITDTLELRGMTFSFTKNKLGTGL